MRACAVQVLTGVSSEINANRCLACFVVEASNAGPTLRRMTVQRANFIGERSPEGRSRGM